MLIRLEVADEERDTRFPFPNPSPQTRKGIENSGAGAPEKGSASMKKQVVLRPFYIFLSFSRTASKAFVSVASKPFACNAATPSMVVPPGEQT